ncbi:MAG: hypothetical protein ACXWJA_13675 [Caldimonas sp.]
MRQLKIGADYTRGDGNLSDPSLLPRRPIRQVVANPPEPPGGRFSGIASGAIDFARPGDGA